MFATPMDEVAYLAGAIKVLHTELETARDKREVMERIYVLESCLIKAALSIGA